MLKRIMLLLCIAASQSTHAQYPCNNGISTNPLNPVNNQLTSKRNTFFNWQDSVYSVQPLTGNCIRGNQIESPFYKIDNLEALRENKDMRWEDGWELIARRFGLTDANSNTIDPELNISFVLYNKYTGVLRVLLKVCSGADYNAARIKINFHPGSQMKTDLLEFSKGQVSALDKTFTPLVYAAGAEYYNDDIKWFYADFPMMYDPCTCIWKSKLQILTDLISTSEIAIEGGITGDIYTNNVAGKAKIQKPGTFGWNEINNLVNNKFTRVFSSIDNFINTTQQLATNFSDPDSLRKLDSALKRYDFLKNGLSVAPWLKASLNLIDIFIGGGKQQPPGGPLEVKLMPLSVNLKTKLNGTITLTNPYHNIIFNNPGSKDVALDPPAYPYYNEVLGIFNLIKTPEVWWERREENLNDWHNYPNATCGTPNSPVIGQCGSHRIYSDRFKLDEATFKWVLNPAAGMTIQNMSLQLITQSEFNAIPSYYVNQGYAFARKRMAGGDFDYVAIDASTGFHTFSTELLPVKNFALRTFRVFSNTTAHSPRYENNFISEYGLWDIWRPRGIVSGYTTAYLKIVLNLKRNNATANTQNVLYALTFPVKLKPGGYMHYWGGTTTGALDTTLTNPASSSEIVSFCNSNVYVNYDNRFSRSYRDSVELAERLQQQKGEALSISPNPNNGQFLLRAIAKNEHLKVLQIIDATGKEVYREQTGSVDLTTGYNKLIALKLPPGMYFILGVTEKRTLRKKFIVKE